MLEFVDIFANGSPTKSWKYDAELNMSEDSMFQDKRLDKMDR